MAFRSLSKKTYVKCLPHRKHPKVNPRKERVYRDIKWDNGGKYAMHKMLNILVTVWLRSESKHFLVPLKLPLHPASHSFLLSGTHQYGLFFHILAWISYLEANCWLSRSARSPVFGTNQGSTIISIDTHCGKTLKCCPSPIHRGLPLVTQTCLFFFFIFILRDQCKKWKPFQILWTGRNLIKGIWCLPNGMKN